MTSSATYLPTMPAPVRAGAFFIAPLAKLYQERARMREFAFAAAVRLSDQDKPIALKLLVELAIVLRVMTQWVRASRSATKTAHSQPRKRATAQPAVRSTQVEQRGAGVNTRRDRRHTTRGVEVSRSQGGLNRRRSGSCNYAPGVAGSSSPHRAIGGNTGNVRSVSSAILAPLPYLC